MKITAKQLRAKGICEGQLVILEKEWPKGVKVTKEALDRANELELNLTWLADSFLSREANEAFEQAMAPAWDAFEQEMWPQLQHGKPIRRQRLRHYGML